MFLLSVHVLPTSGLTWWSFLLRLLCSKAVRVVCVFLITIYFGTATAQSVSCAQVQAGFRQVEFAKARLIAQYPGTAAAAITCAYAASGQQSPGALVALCGLGIILNLGIEETFRLIDRILEIKQYEDQLLASREVCR